MGILPFDSCFQRAFGATFIFTKFRLLSSQCLSRADFKEADASRYVQYPGVRDIKESTWGIYLRIRKKYGLIFLRVLPVARGFPLFLSSFLFS